MVSVVTDERWSPRMCTWTWWPWPTSGSTRRESHCSCFPSQLVPCTPFLSHLQLFSITTRPLYTFPVSPAAVFHHNSSLVHFSVSSTSAFSHYPSLIHLPSLTCSCFPSLLHLSCPICICLPSLPAPCTPSFSHLQLFSITTRPLNPFLVSPVSAFRHYPPLVHLPSLFMDCVCINSNSETDVCV